MDRSHAAEDARLPSLPPAPIWVMDHRLSRTAEPGGAPPSGAAWPAVSPAASIAGRLGLPFRRIDETGPDGRVAPGSLPTLILSCGRRAAARAMLHKARHGGLVVHCQERASPVPGRWLAFPFDLLVAPCRTIRPWFQIGSQLGPQPGRQSGTMLGTIGPVHAVSPALLARARLLWQERLSYLPWPRLALVLGGGAPDPAAIGALARQATALMRARGGCVLASTLVDCPPGYADALAAGLAGGPSLLHRAGEPGPDPALAFMGGADAILAAWTGPVALSEACAADGPVFLASGVPARTRNLARLLLDSDQVRLWPDDAEAGFDPLAAWTRQPLDEAGRVAGAILRRYGRLWNRSLEPDLPKRA